MLNQNCQKIYILLLLNTTESTQSGVFNEVTSAGGKVISDDKTKGYVNNT
ncbi:hypothetical protein Q5M85_20625 [Paraclostridium bifermentans]|nr:hypothetical protein [Paraclostridium bifermentans]